MSSTNKRYNNDHQTGFMWSMKINDANIGEISGNQVIETTGYTQLSIQTKCTDTIGNAIVGEGNQPHWMIPTATTHAIIAGISPLTNFTTQAAHIELDLAVLSALPAGGELEITISAAQ